MRQPNEMPNTPGFQASVCEHAGRWMMPCKHVNEPRLANLIRCDILPRTAGKRPSGNLVVGQAVQAPTVPVDRKRVRYEEDANTGCFGLVHLGSLSEGFRTPVNDG